jgi:hypothetical protein
MEVKWRPGNYFPDIVVGLGNGAVEHYWAGENFGWYQLHDNGFGHNIGAMAVQWTDESDDGNLKVIIGVDNGAVEYYSGNGLSSSGWLELHDSTWKRRT